MKDELLRKALVAEGKSLSFEGELLFSTDSRNLKKANAFICLYGDNFDAFDFIDSILDKNLDVILYEQRPGRDEKIALMNLDEKKIELVAVENIFEFILEIGRLNSESFKFNGGQVIGLTGSNGKTTNKEMLAWLLNGIAPDEVMWTEGNLNNHIGVPLTLLRLNSIYKIAIIEMGTNHPGEIKVLADAAKPTHAMITNIGHAHLEHLKNLDGVYKEKTALFREVEKIDTGFLLINQFDNHLKNYRPKCEACLLNDNVLKLEKDGFTLRSNERDLIVKNVSLIGLHQKLNMAQCLAMALKLFPNEGEALLKLANSFKMPAMNRGEVIRLKGREIYLDAYNANPDSMKASLLSFKEMALARSTTISDCTFILGDMNELGERAVEQHEAIGAFLKEMGASDVCFIGRYAKDYSRGFGTSKTFANTAEARSWLDLSNNSFTFIKGSRSLQLESILDIKG